MEPTNQIGELKSRGDILVVDDQMPNLELMEAMLKPLGHRVRKASDGRMALAQAQASPPDLVILDVVMPQMDGFEVARRLKADPDLGHIPIVMVTGLSNSRDKIKGLEAGANDFLSKPVERAELMARVNSLLQVKAFHDHLREHQRLLEDEVARRTHQLKEALKEIKSTSLGTIIRLSRAAEYRDTDTGSHILRLSHYSAALVRQLGLGQGVAEAVYYAAPMHDVGKIGIPDSILLKPGPLDEAEWLIMRQHPLIGARILRGATTGFLKLAEVIALTHHEKWDGSGYPHGLAGHRIPLAGQVVALADVFDALTSKRPYKEASSLEEAVALISQERGRHFNPRLVEAFLRILPQVREIKARLRDDDTLLQASLDPFLSLISAPARPASAG